MDPLGVIVVAIILAVVLWFRWDLKRTKEDTFAGAAQRRGWEYSESWDKLTTMFRGTPFGTGYDKHARWVMRGEHRGRNFAAFEYSFDVFGQRQRSWYIVVAVATPGTIPLLQVTQDKPRLLDGQRALRLESEEFNKKFHVSGESEKTAHDVLHPMMARLYEDERAAQLPFRFADEELVCWHPGQLHIPSVLTMLDYLSDVLDRVPEFVWEGRTDE